MRAAVFRFLLSIPCQSGQALGKNLLNKCLNWSGALRVISSARKEAKNAGFNILLGINHFASDSKSRVVCAPAKTFIKINNRDGN